MKAEIERKYLVVGDGWRDAAVSRRELEQGYLAAEGNACGLRVRLAGDEAWLTVKGPARGIVRDEFEYAIPTADARLMLERFCGGARLRKRRHNVPWHGWLWEVDEFLDANAGLVLAEVELDSPDADPVLPDWVGAEVTQRSEYLNYRLARHPFAEW